MLGEWPPLASPPPPGLGRQPTVGGGRTAAECVADLTRTRSLATLAHSHVCTTSPALGSRGLRAMLRRYVALTFARGEGAVSPVPSSQSADAPATGARARLMSYQCQRGFGGLGDKLKGFALSVFMALAPRWPLLLLLDCDSKASHSQPFSAAWAPCPGADGHEWRIPQAWTPFPYSPGRGGPNDRNWLHFTNNTADVLRMWSSAATSDAQELAVALATAHSTGGAAVGYHNNMLEPPATRRDRNRFLGEFGPWSWFDWVNATSTSTRSSGGAVVSGGTTAAVGEDADLATLRRVPACGGLPAEVRGLIDGDAAGRACALGLERRGAQALVRRALNASAGYTGASVLPGWGYGAANNNLLYQLLDFLMWPTQTFMDRLLTAPAGASSGPGLLSLYRPDPDQWVISIHLRIGTPSHGSDYTDSVRSPLEASTAAAVVCAERVMAELTAAAGGVARRSALWFVASDRPEVVPALRMIVAYRTAAAAAAASAFAAASKGNLSLPAPSWLPSPAAAAAAVPIVTIIDLGVKKVLHTDNSPIRRRAARMLRPQQQAATSMTGNDEPRHLPHPPLAPPPRLLGDIGPAPSSPEAVQQSAAAAKQREAEERWLETFGDLFLLSAAHGMVRSRSGFSESAAAWGRIPVVYRVEEGRCTHVSPHFTPGEY